MNTTRNVIRGLLMAAVILPLVAADHPMLPDSKLTPGAIDPAVTEQTVQQTICQHGYTATVRNVPVSVKKQVMQRYGLPESDLSRVEIDHFLSLEVGGSNSVENLWPQYYHAAEGQTGYLGAREKDVVETSLHRAVCAGKMTLTEAQDAIRTWPEVYRALKQQNGGTK